MRGTLRGVVGQFVRRHSTVDEAHRDGLVHVERLTEKQLLGGTLVARHARQQPARRRLRTQRQLRKRQREASGLRGIHDIAVQQQCRADADRIARHGRDNGFGRLADRTQELEHGGVVVLRRVFQKVFEIVACRKGLRLPLDQDHAQRRIGLRLGNAFGHCLIHRGGNRILLVRAVEGQHLHRALAMHQYVFHLVCLLGCSGPLATPGHCPP